MSIKAKVDELIEGYRDSVGVTAADLADAESRERICHECDISDDELTEQWAIVYALDGVAVQHSGHMADLEMKAVMRECLKRIHAAGETSSLD